MNKLHCQSIRILNLSAVMDKFSSEQVLDFIKQQYGQYYIWQEQKKEKEYRYFCAFSNHNGPLPQNLSIRTNQQKVYIQAMVTDYYDKNADIVDEGRVFPIGGTHSLRVMFNCKNYFLSPGETFEFTVVFSNITTSNDKDLTFQYSIFSNLECTSEWKTKKMHQLKNGRIFLEKHSKNLTNYVLEVKMKIPENYNVPFIQTPVLGIYDKPSNLRHVFCMKNSYISLNVPDLYQDSFEGILENGSNVWDQLDRMLIKVQPLSNAGKGHLHSNTGM